VFPSTFNYDVVDGQIDLGSGPRDLFTADNLRKFEVRERDVGDRGGGERERAGGSERRMCVRCV